MYRFLNYARVSTRIQVDNTSLEMQDRLCKEFGERQGWTYVSSIRDQGAGDTLERRGVAKTLRMVEAGRVDVVLFFKVDRTAREGEAFQDLWGGIYALGGKVALYEEQRLFPTRHELMRATVWKRVLAEHELHEIRARTYSGYKEHLDRGGFMNRTLYGYTLAKEERDGVKVKVPVVVNEQAKVVQLIINEVAKGTSYHDLSRTLNEAGVPGRTRGSKWGTKAIIDIVEAADRYAGAPFTFKVTMHDETHILLRKYPPIISKEQAEAATLNRKTRPRWKSKTIAPLKNAVSCTCGSTASVVSEPRRKPPHAVSCTTYRTHMAYANQGKVARNEEPRCRGSIGMGIVLERVKNFLEDSLERDTLKRDLAGQYQRLLEHQDETDSLMQTERGLLEERRATVRTLEKLATQEDLPMAAIGALNSKLEQLETMLNEVSGNIIKRRAWEDSTSATMERLGMTQASANVVEGKLVLDNTMDQFSEVNKMAERLRYAIEQYDAPTINELCHLLGLRVTIDFTIHGRKRSQTPEAVKVGIDLEPPPMGLVEAATYVPHEVPRS